jgi:hypothetical protein
MWQWPQAVWLWVVVVESASPCGYSVGASRLSRFGFEQGGWFGLLRAAWIRCKRLGR